MNYSSLKNKITSTIYSALNEAGLMSRVKATRTASVANTNVSQDEDMDKLYIDPTTNEVTVPATGERLGIADENGNILNDLGQVIGSLDADGHFVPTSPEAQEVVSRVEGAADDIASALRDEDVRDTAITDELEAELNAQGTANVANHASIDICCVAFCNQIAASKGMQVTNDGSAYDFWASVTDNGQTEDVFKTFNAFEIPSGSSDGSNKTFVPFKFVGDYSKVDTDALPNPNIINDKGGLGCWGFINKTDKVMIPPIYNAVTPMYGDDKTKRSAMVKVFTGAGADGYQIGFISSEGVWIHEPQWDHGYQAINGQAWYRNEGEEDMTALPMA